MNDRNKRRAMYRTWKKGYYHLCTDGKAQILCHNDSEYANLVNVISILPLKYPVKVHTYQVMKTHVHIFCPGREQIALTLSII